MRAIIVGYGTVGKAQEFLLKKLGHEVFVFDSYGFADQKRPEKLVGFTFIFDDKGYNLRLRHRHDNT